MVWTYLLADALERNTARRSDYLRRICGFEGPVPAMNEPWFEAQPIAPRKSEGNSRIDMALGAIGPRSATNNGIEFSPSLGDWVGFTEAKLLADCSTTVTHAPTRNQLTRVIETLLCFQGSGNYPEQVCFTLLTPRHFFETKHRKSRLYGYKFDEYASDKGAILRDIDLCAINRRDGAQNWTYPALEARVEKLKLHWAVYEDVLEDELGITLDLVAIANQRRMPDAVAQRFHAIFEQEVGASGEAP